MQLKYNILWDKITNYCKVLYKMEMTLKALLLNTEYSISLIIYLEKKEKSLIPIIRAEI